MSGGAVEISAPFLQDLPEEPAERTAMVKRWLEANHGDGGAYAFDEPESVELVGLPAVRVRWSSREAEQTKGALYVLEHPLTGRVLACERIGDERVPVSLSVGDALLERLRFVEPPEAESARMLRNRLGRVSLEVPINWQVEGTVARPPRPEAVSAFEVLEYELEAGEKVEELIDDWVELQQANRRLKVLDVERGEGGGGKYAIVKGVIPLRSAGMEVPMQVAVWLCERSGGKVTELVARAYGGDRVDVRLVERAVKSALHVSLGEDKPPAAKPKEGPRKF